MVSKNQETAIKSLYKSIDNLTSHPDIKDINMALGLTVEYATKIASLQFKKVYPEGKLDYECHHPYREFYKEGRLNDLLVKTALEYLSVVKLCNPFEDIITEIASQGTCSSLGQFMTPFDAAKTCAGIMNTMTNDEIKRHTRKTQPIHTGDITGCGTGTMLLALADSYHSHGDDTFRLVSLSGTDIDRQMSRLAFSQLFLTCIVHGLFPFGIKISTGNAITQQNSETFLFIPNQVFINTVLTMQLIRSGLHYD